MDSRYVVLNREPKMRMALAFYNFIRNNPDWTNRIENTIMYKYKNLSDYDFEYDMKLYSLYYKYLDNNSLLCTVYEFDKFYDNNIESNRLYFNFNLESQSITNFYE